MQKVLFHKDFFFFFAPGAVLSASQIDLFIVDTKYYAGEVCWFSGMFKFVVKLRFTQC